MKSDFFFTIWYSIVKNVNGQQRFITSKELPSKRAGRKPFDVSYRTIVAFRENGKGHSAIVP